MEILGEWRVIFTHDVLLSIAEATGKDPMAGELDIVRPPAAILQAILFAVIARSGFKGSAKDAGRLVTLATIGGIRAALIDGWRASMPEPVEKPAAHGKPLSRMEAWAFARETLKLSDPEWLGITPRMLHALAEHNLESRRQWELMIARLTATTANHGARAPDEPMQPRSLMLHPWPEEKQDGCVTGEELMRIFAPFKEKAN